MTTMSNCTQAASPRLDTLPVELFREILVEWDDYSDDANDDERSASAWSDFYQFYYPNLMALRIISRLWRDTIDSFPYLWRRISTEFSAAQRQLILKNSGEGPLDVGFYFRYLTERMKTHAGGFVEDLSIHSHRWHSLGVWISPDTLNHPITIKLLSSPAPRLKSLILDNSRNISGPLALSIVPFGGTASPHSITIDYLTVPLNWSMISGLRSMDLELLQKNWEPFSSLSALFSFIANMPRLTRLSMNTKMTHYRNDLWSQLRMHLPNIRILHLSGWDDLSTRSVQDIFQNVELSNAIVTLTYIKISDIPSATWVANWFGRHIHRSTGSKLSVAVDGNESEIHRLEMNFMRSRQVTWDEMSYASLSLSGQLEPSDCAGLCRAVCEAIDPALAARTTKVRITGSHTAGALPYILPALSSFLTNVIKVTVSDPLETVAEALQPIRGKWAFPQLKVLSIKWIQHSDGVESLLQAIHARHSVHPMERVALEGSGIMDDWNAAANGFMPEIVTKRLEY